MRVIENKIITGFVGMALALLIVAPAIQYKIPVMINSFGWLYLVVASGLLGMLFALQEVHSSLKILAVYLFLSCFVSQSPYLSFNAYILVVATLWIFFISRNVSADTLCQFIAAAFWVQVIMVCFQMAGMEKLMNFGRDESVFLGTVMQYMRVSSVFAVMAVFLIHQSKWYIVPLILVCVVSKSSSFALSLLVGLFVYVIANERSRKYWPAALAVAVVSLLAYAVYDFHSFKGAIMPEHGGRLTSWYAALTTWIFDTSSGPVPIRFFGGEFRLEWLLFGHGMDTFLPLFPVYKQDFNPFPQAHNDWLQILWETGLIGFSLIAWYCASVIRRLIENKASLHLAGWACIGVNMFFAFPSRMTQTMILIVVFAALSERYIWLSQRSVKYRSIFKRSEGRYD